jgi:hypothetical protein
MVYADCPGTSFPNVSIGNSKFRSIVEAELLFVNIPPKLEVQKNQDWAPD